jgi:hypothetical protein
MFYLTKKRFPHSKITSRRGLFVVLVLLLVVLAGLQMPRLIIGGVYSGISGMEQFEDVFHERVAYTLLLREDKTSLAAEVLRLRAELQEYMHDKELLNYLVHERDVLLERVGELGEDATHGSEGVEGRIVDYRSLFNRSVFAVRTAHSKTTPDIGALVQDASGIPIGEVIDVVQGVVLVRPYSGRTEPFSVMIGVGSSTIHATAQGRGVDTVVVKVPRGVDVDLGTSVYIPAHGKPLGRVSEVVSLPEDAEQELYVELIADIRAIQTVRIMPLVFSVEMVEQKDN